MRSIERLLQIEALLAQEVARIVPLELDGETLRLIVYLRDDTHLRGAEQWSGATLNRYSYYWLTAAGRRAAVSFECGPEGGRV
jgi:hypothetical protein